MAPLTILLPISGALALGAMSPGPSFVMVARTAVARSRADGLAAAFGMGAGGVLFAVAALLGLQALLTAVPWLYRGLRIAGGLYLIYLGYRSWAGATLPLQFGTPGQSTHGSARGRAFFLGFSTQISNPKTAVVYASIFATFLPAHVPPVVAAALPLFVFCIETGWYAVVALGLSAPAPRSAYLQWKVWIDRASGSVLALLGLRLIRASAVEA
jgi:threonine/homoserine/homoserine lactone efflux protein